MSYRNCLPILVSSLLSLFATLDGATLILTNGDRLEGKEAGGDDTHLVWESDSFGTLRVPSALVAEIKVDPAPELAVASEMPMAAVVDSDSNEDTPPTKDGEEASSFLLSLLDTINPFTSWKSKLSLGYIWTGAESSSQDFLFLFTAHRKLEDSDLRVLLRYDYGNNRPANGTWDTVTDKYRAEFRYRRDLFGRVFGQWETLYYRDNVLEIDHQLDQNIGLGIHLIQSDQVALTVSGLLTGRYLEVNGVADGWEGLLTFQQEFRYKIHERISFSEEAQVSFEPNETQDADYSFVLRLENRITERLSFDLRYENEFTYVVGVGVNRKQQKVLASLGYEF